MTSFHINLIKMSNVPELIHKLKMTPIKIPTGLFMGSMLI